MNSEHKKMYRMDTGKDILGAPVEKPRNWKPLPTREWDTSKVARHHLDDGLEFYWDMNIGGVSTTREDTYLRLYSWGANTDYAHEFFALSIYGEKLFVLPSRQAGKGFSSANNRTDDGRYIWTFGEFRGRVEIRDVYTYPWAPYGEAVPWITWDGIGQFRSLEQQKHFLSVLERFLDVLGRSGFLEILEGKDSTGAVVEYDPEIQEKIDTGELLL